ncbi:MAG: M48 family metallopeptidase [Bacteroidales bacterium]|nr:M48 family metallopeptidase [Bacteroidales bacterium]
MVIFSCAKVPITGRKQFTAVPTSQLISLSKESYQQVIQNNELSDNNVYINTVKNVGTKISGAVEQYMKEQGMEDRLEGYQWEYHVLESDEKNAWCMPGGKIAFYEGIMPICKDDNGVAVVMAHEIAHAVANHGNERMSQQLLVQLGGMALSVALEEQKETTQQLALAAFGLGTSVGVLLPYSRTHEQEADELGLYFMAMAGFDPRGAPEFWARMQQQGGASVPEFLSTHPNPENRIKYLRKVMPKALKFYNK